MGCFVLGFSAARGEVSEGRQALSVFWAILYARFIGKPAYLEPIRILIAN
jgi:hypothetical protein